MDFTKIKMRSTREGAIEVFPDFRVGRHRDIMIRGGDFYAVWNPATGLWSLDEYDIQELVDSELAKKADELSDRGVVNTKYLSDYSSGSWTKFKSWLSRLSDQSKQLDEKVAFSNTEVLKKDHITHKQDYPLEEGDTPAFDELFGTLYSEPELKKIMWAIGSIVAGESRHIQKFLVFFGAPGTGKSTALNLIQKMFPNHYVTFDAKSLTTGTNSFAAEAFRNNPLIGISHEGDLSRIKDNSLLNSIVSHDQMLMNVKFQSAYRIRLNTMLFMATNKAVNITDAQSGVIRRLIDVRPTNQKVEPERYDILVNQMDFELGAIAYKCLETYKKMGKSYYSRYKPVDMMLRTNVIFNFVEEHQYDFMNPEPLTLTRAWKMYKEFCEETGITYRLARHNFRDELKAFFKSYEDRIRIEGKQYRSVFIGFDDKTFEEMSAVPPLQHQVEEKVDWLNMKKQPSLLDIEFKKQQAQYEKKYMLKWEKVDTLLESLQTGRLHYVLPKENHIVIDLDLKDKNGNKSLALNLEAAAKFPPTYAELSKSGEGLHLHYYYEGDITKLSRVYEEGIEILVAVGLFSIRRKLTKCNDVPIATISSGLPLKGESMISEKRVKSERAIRALVLRNLNKEIHPATRPSMDFIKKILDDAYKTGVPYDIENLKPAIMQFASKSTNQAPACIKIALNLHYKSEDPDPTEDVAVYSDERLVIFDIEVLKNLLIISWKYKGSDQIQRLVNPSPAMVEPLLKMKLVGFNNRRYDNHILYAAYLGYNNMQLYNLSKRIINNDKSALFREAYNLSWADAYEYFTLKQSLKKWQVEYAKELALLGISHKEFQYDWDEELPEDKWDECGDYCDNDVLSLEAIIDIRMADYRAREIIAELSGLPINAGDMQHAARILFGNDRNPQRLFNYVDLSEEFPGYTFKMGKSSYRGEDPKEGGYVYAEPGIYRKVLYLDVASMHPKSIEMLQLFGAKATKNFCDIRDARIDIKEGDIETAKTRFDGRLAPYLDDPELIEALAYALKIFINRIYGYTSARFDCIFRDPRNKDNIVAKRGALFMIDLKHYLWEKDKKCVHFKTDSVKIADSVDGDFELVREFGLKYGYEFGIEDRFEKMALVNDAVLIAKTESGHWEAVGAQFAEPYVFKTLFSKEPLEFNDHVIARGVKKGEIYIDNGKSMSFVGRVGRFVPVKKGGGDLLRVADDKKHAVTGTKGYKWQLADVAEKLGLPIDEDYFKMLTDKAVDHIAEFGDVTMFLD